MICGDTSVTTVRLKLWINTIGEEYLMKKSTKSSANSQSENNVIDAEDDDEEEKDEEKNRRKIWKIMNYFAVKKNKHENIITPL